MFNVSLEDINRILEDYGFTARAAEFDELQRYHYERDNPDSKEVRLIVRVHLDTGASVVIRFKNEEDVTRELLESQCRFAELLRENGILTPAQYRSEGDFVRRYSLNGYEVLVAIEDFVQGQVKIVDEAIAEKTGALLARTHTIAETFRAHVENEVLFDPFRENDLFFYSSFEEIAGSLEGEARVLAEKIIEKYKENMAVLAPLKDQPRYAVQGDISDCNLYQTPEGEIGIFDFNRCGDNNLYCDAVMEAVFEARLMDYPEAYQGKQESIILPAFLRGYQAVRPFDEAQKKMLPCLYTVIHAFWGQDIWWGERSLHSAFEKGDKEEVQNWLKEIWRRISGSPVQEILSF